MRISWRSLEEMLTNTHILFAAMFKNKTSIEWICERQWEASRWKAGRMSLLISSFLMDEQEILKKYLPPYTDS